MFGMHSILWFIRSLTDRFPSHHHVQDGDAAPRSVKRFRRIDRVNHIFVIITFFGLTLTGMPLLFADEPWAGPLVSVFGGVHTAGILHRIFGVGLICNFLVHMAGVVNRCRKYGVRNVLLGPNSLLPRWRDVKDAIAMTRWFFGGKRPTFDHWTYWEKFDYWAEIFGTFVIGGTGLLLWFASSSSHFVPGWMFNVAAIIHGYEALLAVGFIFSIHFFNAHLRPSKFPVDDVIFTGRLPEAEFIEERGDEYHRLVEAGEFEQLISEPPPRWWRRITIIGGITAMLIGTAMVILIVLAGLDVLQGGH
jgi:cytochrome b subunit of formate dehydrogenase